MEHSESLYRYIWGIVKQKNCVLYRINGMEDHIHMFTDLHPNLPLADFVRDIKTSSSLWLKDNKNFPDFNGWSVGYAALTYGFRDKNMIIGYIKKQREHHKKTPFIDEYQKLLTESGIIIDKSYFP